MGRRKRCGGLLDRGRTDISQRREPVRTGRVGRLQATRARNVPARAHCIGRGDRRPRRVPRHILDRE